MAFLFELSLHFWCLFIDFATSLIYSIVKSRIVGRNIMYETDNKGSKNLKLAILMILLIISFVGYNANKPKTIFATSMNKAYKDFLSISTSLKSGNFIYLAKGNTITNEMNLRFNIQIEDETDNYKEITDLINKFKLNMIYSEDNQKKERVLRFNPIIEDKSLFNVLFYALNNKQYIYLGKIFDRFIELDDAEYETVYDDEYIADIEFLTGKIQGLLLKQIKNSDFTKKAVKITVDGEVINTNKVTFNLTRERYREIISKVLADLRDDKASLDAITRIANHRLSTGLETTEITREMVISNINEIIDALSDNYQTSLGPLAYDLYISVYAKKISNIPIKYELSYEHENYYYLSDDKPSENKISYLTYNTKDNIPVKEINITIEDNDIFCFKLEKINDNEHNYSIRTFDEDEEDGIRITGVINYEKIEVHSNKEFDINLSISVVPYVDGKKIGVFSFELDSKVIIGESLENISMKNPIKYDELSEEDITSIYEGILETISEYIEPIMAPRIESSKKATLESMAKIIIKGIEYRMLEQGYVETGDQLADIDYYGASSTDFDTFIIHSTNPVRVTLVASDTGRFAGWQVIDSTYTMIEAIPRN
jgi:hypothetical protein